METLEFSTPAAPARTDEHVTVTLAGEDITCHRPKDATLFFASSIIADEVSLADRAMGMVQFVNGVLDPSDQKRFYDRVIDREDPLGQRAVVNLLAVLTDHWGPDGPRTGPLVAEQDTPATFYGAEPVQVVNRDAGLEFVAYPPKDLVMSLVSSGIATGAGMGQQAWAVGLFLDACTDPGTRLVLSQRMRDRADALDLEHITDVVLGLTERWAPDMAAAAGNRAQRRAATRSGKAGKAVQRRGQARRSTSR